MLTRASEAVGAWGVLLACAAVAALGSPPAAAHAAPVPAAHGHTASGRAGSAPALATRPAGLVEATWADLPLLADGAVVGPGGGVVAIPTGGSAVVAPALRQAQSAWIANGTVPGPTERSDLAVQALRDLDALVLADGSAIAAASPGWDLVWPRDASFVAAALARTGHPGDALAVLERLAALHAASADGVFEARYVPSDGSVPDGRARQLDGCGWALWAVAHWRQAAPGDPAGLATLEPMVRGCLDAIDREVSPVTGLPGPWPDYWEVAETVPTLGTVAALLAGVSASAPVAAELGGGTPDQVARLRERLERGVAAFGPTYSRHLGGSERDTAVAFLMPPFAADADPGVHAAWLAALDGMARPAGGLAPGEAWRRDGVSWTPTTTVFALTAAGYGDRSTADALLDWLDTHRTSAGALPEKVLGDGSPAGPAPLAWTSALVLLTLDELDRLDARTRPDPSCRAGRDAPGPW